MKKIILLLLTVLVTGCAYEGKKVSEYFDDPRSFIKDPHFSNYKENRDALESQYLRKEISYADYLEKTKKLDEEYARDVQQRDEKIGE